MPIRMPAMLWRGAVNARRLLCRPAGMNSVTYHDHAGAPRKDAQRALHVDSAMSCATAARAARAAQRERYEQQQKPARHAAARHAAVAAVTRAAVSMRVASWRCGTAGRSSARWVGGAPRACSARRAYASREDAYVGAWRWRAYASR